jgi:hypothetical protein
MTLINLNLKFKEIKEAVANVHFADVQLSEFFKAEYEKYLLENNANGYSKVEWVQFSTKITTSSGKIIFITNFWFYIASELSNYLDGLSQQKEIFRDIYKGSDLQDIANLLRGGVPDEHMQKVREYFSSNGLSDEDLDHFLSFVSDYKSWGGGKTIDRNDYYVSPLLQAGNLLAETQSAVAEIAKQMSENPSLKASFCPTFVPFNVPLKNEALNKSLLKSNTIRTFVKELFVYLFENGLAKHLLAYVQVSQKNDGKNYFELVKDNRKINRLFLISKNPLTEDDLTSGSAIRYFNESFDYENQLLYLTNQWADNDTESKNSRDLGSFTIIFNSIFENLEIIKSGGIYSLVEKRTNRLKISHLPKPFLLLAGISGTGKSRFVRKQAEATSNGKANFELVSVRPDWHEPSDLLGYVSRLGNDGAEYVVTNVLKFMVKAWLDVIDKADAQSWTPKSFEQISPFWLCLDEMNLAPVEQYFADYLSVIETRDWQEGEYRCDPLLKKDVFEQLTQAALVKLQKELGLAGHDALWQYFLNNGIAIPFNLIVAGTVNMDETTHGFSRKVIDRALSFDFGEFFPNDVEEFFDAQHQPKAFSYPIHSQAKLDMFASVTADSDAVKTKAFFNAINNVLKNTPFELAYRAFNELCLSVISFAPKTELELAAVFDDFLMCKVLPRIEGDDDKLLGGEEQNLLEQLEAVLAVQLTDIWQVTRPDLLREVIKLPEQVIPVPCRSKGKLTRMKKLLESGFTSFWP